MTEVPSIVKGNNAGYADPHMPVVISLLRAVNLGGHNVVKMEALRKICESLGFGNVRTWLQSGNLVFTAEDHTLETIAATLENAIERELGVRTEVINRTAEEIAGVIDANPFAQREGLSGSKLLVTFLADDPGEKARQQVRHLPTAPEELFIEGRELYIYYPNGIGRSKLRTDLIGKALKMPGTARNWNTVMKLHELARAAEKSEFV